MSDLIKEFDKLRSVAEHKLDEARSAIEAGEFEKAEGLQKEADGLLSQVNVIKAQIDRDNLVSETVLEAPKEAEKTAARLPFDTEVVDEDSEPTEGDRLRTIHVLKYGEPHKAVSVVASDMYGSERNYFEAKDKQGRAFEKYIRLGEHRLRPNEQDDMDQIIYTSDQILNEIKSGFTVSEIKSNKATLQESSLELGGHLVPEDMRLEIIKRLMGITAVRGRARQVSTVRDKVDWPVLLGGNSRYTSAVRISWIDEVPASDQSETNFTLGNVSVPVHTVMASTNVSRNLLEDSGVDIISLIVEQFSEAMAIDEDEQFLIGTGGNTPQGILGGRSGAEYTPVTGITAVNSGAASTLTADGLISIQYDLDAQYMQQAIWVGAKSSFAAIRKLKDGESNYLWAPGLERGAPPVLLGHDYVMNEAMPAVGANNHVLIWGDMRGYLIVDRVGMTIERVQDTTTVGRNYVALFGRRRLGGQVVEPWRFRAQKVSA
jgi:HK97 family phage major capsid protein